MTGGVGERLCKDAPMRPSHFVLTDEGTYEPTAYAQSHWGDDHLNGPAVAGLAAYVLEEKFGAGEFLPARTTVDLFKAARSVPTTASLRLVRDGRRIRNAECEILQGGVVVARAVVTSYRTSAPPSGTEWRSVADFAAPVVTDDDAIAAYVGSDELGWTRGPGDHQNTTRKRFYNRGIDIVGGQPNSPYVRAVMLAESTSFVTNLGTEGVGYINGDLTVGLARLPVSEWIGVQADSHWTGDGVAVGTATLFDDDGAFGSGMVTAIANPAAQIDFTGSSFLPEKV